MRLLGTASLLSILIDRASCLSVERPDLCDKQTVGQIEAKLMQVLYRHLRRHHPSNDKRIFYDYDHLTRARLQMSQTCFWTYCN